MTRPRPTTVRLATSSRLVAAVSFLTFSALAWGPRGVAGEEACRSPLDVAFSPDGARLAVSDHTAGALLVVDVEAARVLRDVTLRGRPAGVLWSPGDRIWVAEYGAGTVAEVDATAGDVVRRLAVGLRPMGLALARRRGLLVAANTVEDDVSLVDLDTGAERARVRVPREPHFVAVTPDESLAVAGNLLPAGRASDPMLSAAVTLIDLERLERKADVRLPAGSTAVRELVVSADGRWAYAVHTVGRFNVPATQLDRGWVNTNALSVIDLAAGAVHATVLLDHVFEGAADPWGVSLASGGSALWVSLRGVHQLARVEIAALHRLLDGGSPEQLAPAGAQASIAPGIWAEIRQDTQRRASLVNDLAALHVANLIERMPLPGNGPRGLDISPDGERLAVAMYYSGSIAFADAASGRVSSTGALGPERPPDAARRGEILFHDATLCFQRWLSCATCHPDDARTDGLRWDLLNDGLGTPQRTRSLLFSHRIRPTTARGVRKGIEESVPKGLLFLLHRPDAEVVASLIAYLEALDPEPSPHLAGGELSGSARRGKALFEGKAACAGCHEGELGTDLKAHDVGTRGELDRPGEKFYTPKLVELYRTAPYLHDGRAATLLEVLTLHDPERRHGKTAELTPEELADLVEFLKSR